MLDHTHQHRHQQQSGYQRIEVITGQRRRRQWSEDLRAADECQHQYHGRY